MKWYQSLSRGRQIAALVVITHGFLVCMLGGDHWLHRVKAERKKIIVNSIVYRAPAKTISPSTKVKTQHVEGGIKKQTISKKSVLYPSNGGIASDALLTEIEENLDALTKTTSASQKSTITIPDFVSKTQTSEYSTDQQIVGFLQEALELPEFGSVKIQLSINGLGTLEELVIL